MKNNFVFTFLLLQIVNISSFTETPGISISQEKCKFYRDTFQQPSDKDFPFLVRIYSGYYYNGDLIIESDGKFLNGVIISENFVLTVANNRTESLLVEVIDMQLEVIQRSINDQQTIMLLMLSKSVELGADIRPVCLPQSNRTILSQIICWVDNNWLNHIKLKLPPRGSCKKNSEEYIKKLRIQGVNGTNFCHSVVEGDRDKCNEPGSILLNDNQEVVGVATESDSGHPQIYLQISDHVPWIENIVWPSKSVISTTVTIEETSQAPRETSTTIVFNSTTTKTSSSNESKQLGRTDVELHDIHVFLNVNLILIVVILFLVLFISSILWSDGLCIRAALPDQDSTSTDV